MPRARSTNPSAIRKRRYRDRVRRNVGVAQVEYDGEVVDHPVALGVLSDAESLDSQKIAVALTRFIRAASK